MRDHVERQKDEVFLYNLEGEVPEYLKPLQTLRLGNQAFDIYGVPLGKEHRPVFINKSEHGKHERIRENRLRAIMGR